MIIVCEAKATEEQIVAVVQAIVKVGLKVHRSDGAEHTVLGVVGDRSRLDVGAFSIMPGVRDVIIVSKPYKLASREFHSDDTIVTVGEGVQIGGGEVVVLAGPCSVESTAQIDAIAEFVARSGGRVLRGGAFKPRSSPYSFQGLGVEGLKLLRDAAKKHGLATVLEVMTIEQIPVLCEHVDLLQVAGCNMQNYPLLTAPGGRASPCCSSAAWRRRSKSGS